MKSIKNIKLLMVAGLLLQVGIGFAADRWEPTGPTVEDILAATKVENLAAKGSREDKLISAVKNGDLKNVETFIAAGAGLEARDNGDMTALMIAANKGYTDIVSKLISAGANVNAKDRFGCTAFFKAADKGHTEIVKLLIANGAAKNEKNFGELFVRAVFQGNNEMVKALIVEGASIDHDTLDTAYSIARNRRCSAEIVNAIKELQRKPHG